MIGLAKFKIIDMASRRSVAVDKRCLMRLNIAR
jgi:hypothetical protein